MRKTSFFSTVLSLFLLVPASITWAQTISSQKGLTTAVFTTASGTIKVYLPDDIRPGDHISGRIVANPAGKTAKQVENNLTSLKKYSIGINNEKFTVDDVDKPFQFLVNSDRQLNGPMELIDVSGNKIASLAIPIIPVKDQQPAPAQCMIPSHALTGSPLRIRGPFDGNSSNTNISLDNRPLAILTKSPRQAIVLYPADATGIKTLNVQESGKQICSQQVSGVQMNVSAGKLDLHSGENTFIDISITGLQHLPDTALLTLINMTTGVVVMLPSNSIVIPLLPDSVGSGTFNKKFDIQSIRTGTFSVNVTLDLPEVQATWPPTQPQPDNPQPKDTTQPQPPHDSTTVVQCPKCGGSCTAKMSIEVPEGKDKEISVYSVAVTAFCTGQFGNQPCAPCKIIGEPKYEWQVSFSFDDGITMVGNNSGSSFRFKNPKKAPFFVTVKVTVTCSDGSQYSCTDKITSPSPTVPVEKEKCTNCQCECSVSIKALDKLSDVWAYIAVVTGGCMGKYGEKCEPCISSYTYVFTITDGDGEVVTIVARNGPIVGIKPLKKGKFKIHVVVTVTCPDKKSCTCEITLGDEVLDDGCVLTWKEIVEPKMTGGLDPSSLKTKTIRRDDFIALKAIGEDDDYLKLFCTSIDCKDGTSSVKYQKLSGMVRFEWKIEGETATGSFVKLGFLPENEKKAVGEQVIFKPPYVPFPSGKDADGKEITETKVWTDIILSVIDDNPDQPIDKTIERTIAITTRRTKANPDFYEVSFRQVDKMPEEKFVPEETKGVCEVIVWPWTDVTPIAVPVIKLPAGANNNQLVSGEWMVLEANEQIERDHLKANCKTANNCNLPRVFDKDYADPLEWEWTIKEGGGIFVGSGGSTDKGRFVIYEAPKTITEQREITINVRVYNKSPKFPDSDDGKTATIKIAVYPGGIKLDFPPPGWLPDPDKPAKIKSWLVYKDKEVWKPAFEHFRRIHFFELMDVSEEKGICMNAPLPDKAKPCRDLKIKNEKGHHEAFLDTCLRKEFLKDCNGKEYFMQARTEVPENSYTINIYSEDYGAYGFLRSFANINKGGSDNTKGDKPPLYESVPLRPSDVKHPSKTFRYVKLDYEDNRISIPQDIDNNHMPDNGWFTVDGKAVDDPLWDDDDDDDLPVGDGVPGDGFTNYEEYRGFMTIKQMGKKPLDKIIGLLAVPAVTKEAHIRADPDTKTLFIHRVDAKLDISLFEKVSGLETHLIIESQYNHEKIKGTVIPKRWVNFNYTNARNVIEQWGLKLINDKALDKEKNPMQGIALNINTKERPSPPNWEYASIVDIKMIENNIKDLNKKIEMWNDNHKNDKNFLAKNKVNLEDKIRQVVTHELLHGCNVCHHGEKIAGQGYDTPEFGGLRSGNIDCVMRYDNLGNVVEFPPDYFPEKIGTILCDNPVGTGFNTPAKGQQQGRGNALRGDCIHQIHVSARGGQAPACAMDPPPPKKK